MPNMFFPDEEELQRQMVLAQQPVAPQVSASYQPQSQGIRSPELFRDILSQLQSTPLSEQVAPVAPEADDLMMKYGEQLKGLQQQLGMQSVSPEEREKINDDLRWQAFFADRKRSLSGQPSEQYALAKTFAAQKLNPGAENVDRLNKSLELLKGLKALEGTTKDNTLRDLLTKEKIEEISTKNKLKADANDPDSAVSQAAVEAFTDDISERATNAKISNHKSINNLAPTLEKFAKMAAGKSANQIEELYKRVKEAQAQADKEAGFDVSKEIGGGRNFILGEGLKIKTGHDEQERADAIRKVAIPGFDFFDIQNVQPDPQKSKIMSNIASAAMKMQSTANKMSELVNQKGLSVQDRVGVGNQLNRLRQELIVQSKEVDRLGALAGADIKIETGKIPDATSVLQALEGKGSFNTRMAEFKQIINEAVTHTAPFLGYTPKPEMLRALERGDVSLIRPSGGALRNPPLPPDEPQAGPKQLSAEEKKALEWANKNPNDPRAAKIKEKIGVK